MLVDGGKEPGRGGALGKQAGAVFAEAQGRVWGRREAGYSDPCCLWHGGEETAEAESTAHRR